MEMTMMITASRGFTPCSLIDTYRRFGGRYLLHIQGVRISRRFLYHENRVVCSSETTVNICDNTWHHLSQKVFIRATESQGITWAGQVLYEAKM
jgi:hypothetical protein